VDEKTPDSARPKFFLRIVDAELCDFLEDLEMVELRQSEQFENLKISHYVYLENSGLLAMERECLKLILEQIRKWDGEAYADCASVGGAVIDLARDMVDRFEYPESVVAIMQRKIDKITRYLGGQAL
jgi:hypothetical protein